MRKVVLMIMAAAMLVSCGTSGKAAKETVKTYVQPGADLLNAPGVLRAWAVGVSDSQMAAKKKAMVSASSQLAQTLNSVVTTTIEDDCVKLSDADAAVSKEFLNKKCSSVSQQVLVGVRPIFEQWEPVDAEGKHKIYIVLELSGEEFIKKLLEAIGQSQGTSNVKIDEQLLGDIFNQKVNSGK